MTRHPARILLLVLLIGLLPASGPARALDKDITDRVLRAAVKLLTPFDADPEANSLCSGSMVDDAGYILTNFHCIGYPMDGERQGDLEALGLKPGDLYNEKGLSIVALTSNPRQLPVPTYVAKAVAADPRLDLAVLKVVAPFSGKKPLPGVLPVVEMPLADSDLVGALDEVFVIGYPGIGGDTVTATEGKVSGFLDEDGDGVTDWIKTDVLVNQGNSGGSAINDAGALIGIPTIRRRDESGNVIYLIRPTNVAVPYLEKALTATGTRDDLGTAQAPSDNMIVGPGDYFGEIIFGTGFDEEQGVTGQAWLFPAGTTQVHAGLPYANMRDGQRWSYTWFLDDQPINESGRLRWKFGPEGKLDLFLRSDGGLAGGTYALRIFLDGEPEATSGFLVEGGDGPGPRKPGPQQPADVTVIGSVFDQDTGRGIANATVIVLKPGVRVRTFDRDRSKSKSKTVLAVGVTDAGGAFTLGAPLPRGEVYGAIVMADGYQRIAQDGALEITETDPDLLELEAIPLERR